MSCIPFRSAIAGAEAIGALVRVWQFGAFAHERLCATAATDSVDWIAGNSARWVRHGRTAQAKVRHTESEVVALRQKNARLISEARRRLLFTAP